MQLTNGQTDGRTDTLRQQMAKIQCLRGLRWLLNWRHCCEAARATYRPLGFLWCTRLLSLSSGRRWAATATSARRVSSLAWPDTHTHTHTHTHRKSELLWQSDFIHCPRSITSRCVSCPYAVAPFAVVVCHSLNSLVFAWPAESMI